MARCIIICPLWQGERLEELRPAAGDLLLCADAGLAAAWRYGLRPELTIGDFDTMPAAQAGTADIRVLPVHKDDTDLGVCLQEGRSRGYRRFVLAGCLGGRLDHTLAMLQLMADCAMRGEECMAVDAVNTVTILTPGTHILPRQEGTLLSLLSFSDRVTGVTLTGTEWPLEDGVLTQRYPLGISNRITAPEAWLSFTEGLLLVDRSVNGTWCKNTEPPLV